ncbi:MFS transporter [Antiquaquibacter oligotrophicus]|nr:MFS transporter [Antiquaquibacter oligotrophicus]
MTRRQLILVFVGLMAGLFLSSLDQTIVSTSMRTIADDLDGLTLQSWVATAYLITSTIGTPIYGKLSDIFGRRPLFIAAIVIFLIGSAAAGFADSMYQLAGFRAIQGLGAGGLMALPLAIMGDVLAPRERARAQGIFLGVFGLSSVAGPLLGGVFSSQQELFGLDGWRWVFLLNVPIGLAALAIVLRFLRLPHTKREVKIDWWGAAAVVVALVPLLVVAEQGRDWGWASPGALLCYVVGVAGIVAFILIEMRMGDDALIPLALFRNQTFAMATILGVFVGFGMFGSMLTAPLYLQLVNNSSPMVSGLQMLPMLLGLMIASIVTGQIIGRTGRYGVFFRTGMVALTLGFLWLTFLTADKGPLWVMTGTFIIGLGLGQLLQTLTIASQNSVTARDLGVATTASTFFRSLGGTLGVSILFSIIFTRLPDAIEAAADRPIIKRALIDALAFDPQVRTNQANQAIIDLFDDGVGGTAAEDAFDSNSNFLLFADHRLTAPFREGFNDAAVSAYWVGFAVMVIGLAISFFITTAPLRDKSAIDEAADDAAAADAPAKVPAAR